jgi:hypothetical protein
MTRRLAGLTFVPSLPCYTLSMLELLTKWDPEDDPITREQAETLALLLDGSLTEKALEGFLIVCSRLVDEFGNHRTEELSKIFRTNTPEGRCVLLRSLEYVNDWVGGMEAYKRLYPVTIIPPNPAFPQLKIVGIEMIETVLYRVMDSNAVVRGTSEFTKLYIQRTGRLPGVPVQTVPVLRSKPLYHWCSYEKWDTPALTQAALQILPEYENNCQLRVTIITSSLTESTFMAFNGDRYDPSDSKLRFYKYFYEPVTQDHPALTGGGVQVGLDGAPPVETLEEWDELSKTWNVLWRAAH